MPGNSHKENLQRMAMVEFIYMVHTCMLGESHTEGL